MAKVGRRTVLTPKPIRLYYDRVFGHYWASKGPGDHAEGYDGPGPKKGPFGHWSAFVSEDRAEVEEWLRLQRTRFDEIARVLRTVTRFETEATPAPRPGARQSKRRPSRG